MTLTRTDLSELRGRLETRAQSLRDELRETVAKSNAEKAQLLRDEVRDNGDDSFLDLIVDVNLAEVDRDLVEYRAVNAALTRMQTGAYGECIDCSRPIAIERLRALPMSARCVTCQERHEKLTDPAATPRL